MGRMKEATAAWADLPQPSEGDRRLAEGLLAVARREVERDPGMNAGHVVAGALALIVAAMQDHIMTEEQAVGAARAVGAKLEQALLVNLANRLTAGAADGRRHPQ